MFRLKRDLAIFEQNVPIFRKKNIKITIFTLFFFEILKRFEIRYLKPNQPIKIRGFFLLLSFLKHRSKLTKCILNQIYLLNSRHEIYYI